MTVHTVPRALKETIRQARDKEARDLRDELIQLGAIAVCFECDCDLDTYTTGCGCCQDRRQRARPRRHRARK